MPHAIIRNKERGHVDHGWLKTAHSFSFAHYVNRERMNFGALLVVNEDTIAAKQGFGEHFHDNMEIITIPLSGALEHQDSLGNGSVVRAGDVQIMSAGTGIMHSEKNPGDEPVHLLQIWIIPEERGLSRRYEQWTFDPKLFKDVFYTLVSAKPVGDQLKIYQDASIRIGDFGEEKTFTLPLTNQAHGIFLLVIEGKMQVGEETLETGDTYTAWNESEIRGKALSSTKLLAIEVPMEF